MSGIIVYCSRALIQADADGEQEDVLAGAASGGQNRGDEDEGADGLAEEVAREVLQALGGVGREDVALRDGVDHALGRAELVGVHEPRNDGAHKAAEHVSDHVRDAGGPGHQAHDALGQDHGRVHADGTAKDEQGHRDAKGPGGDCEHVAGALVLGTLEDGVAVNAHAEDDHERRAAKLAQHVVEKVIACHA